MLYRAAARSVLRAVSNSNASVARSALPSRTSRAQLTSFARQPALLYSTSLALVARKPVSIALVRYASTIGTKKPPVHPSKGMSTKVPKGHDAIVEDPDVDMMAGIRNDMKVVRETFSLKEVPKEALYLGLAGVIPYLATSLQTTYLAWEMNNAMTTGSGHFISGETAELVMGVIEPIQIGYGAVILSFLGAVHWGLEWAGYGGRVGYRRYATGVIAPAVAWPTLLLPAEYALITQFLAFTFLYYNDARAAIKGWTPPWYAMYRFVLTFVVGASIVFSLIGRERLASHYDSKHGVAEKLRALRAAEWVNEEGRALEKQEKTNNAAESSDGDE